jgi:F0F1-type ATP synthase assembly protein I
VTDPRDDRSPFAAALEWTSRTTAISLEMVAPAVFGWWLDRRWGTLPLCLLVGVALGFLTSLMSLLQLAKTAGKNKHEKDDPPQ